DTVQNLVLIINELHVTKFDSRSVWDRSFLRNRQRFDAQHLSDPAGRAPCCLQIVESVSECGDWCSKTQPEQEKRKNVHCRQTSAGNQRASADQNSKNHHRWRQSELHGCGRSCHTTHPALER